MNKPTKAVLTAAALVAAIAILVNQPASANVTEVTGTAPPVVVTQFVPPGQWQEKREVTFETHLPMVAK